MSNITQVMDIQISIERTDIECTDIESTDIESTEYQLQDITTSWHLLRCSLFATHKPLPENRHSLWKDVL